MKAIKITLLILFTLLFSCKKEEDSTSADAQFFKVYDESGLGNSYTPLDVVQNTDGSFLFLTEKSVDSLSFFPIIHLVKTDKEGEVITQSTLNSGDYVGATKKIVVSGGNNYIVCMNSTGGGSAQGTNILQVADDLSVSSITSLTGNDFFFPLAANATAAGNLILLSYDNSGSAPESNFSIIDLPGGSVSSTVNYNIGTSVPESNLKIQEHLQRDASERQLPFFVGQIDATHYYFNGHYNGQLSTVFVNSSSPVTTNPPQLQGFRNIENVSSLLPDSDTTFLVSNYESGPNQLIGNKEINYQDSASIENVVSISSQSVSEFEDYAQIVTKKIGSKIILGGTTFNGRIVLYGMNGNQVKGKEYLGFNNDFELASFTETQDGGLFVLGRISYSGVLKRVVAFKLSASDISNL